MTRCAVSLCRHDHRKTNKQGISYHRFPKDDNLKAEWVKRCERSGSWNPETSHVCSAHFKDEDFVSNDLKNKLLGITSKRRLNKNAIPSLFLGMSSRDLGNIKQQHNGLDQNTKTEVMFEVEHKKIISDNIVTLDINPNSKSVENTIIEVMSEVEDEEILSDNIVRLDINPTTKSDVNTITEAMSEVEDKKIISDNIVMLDINPIMNYLELQKKYARLLADFSTLQREHNNMKIEHKLYKQKFKYMEKQIARYKTIIKNECILEK